MKYDLEFTTQAKKDIKRLDKGIQRSLVNKLAKLCDNPYGGFPLRGGLKDFYSIKMFFPGGQYRAA